MATDAKPLRRDAERNRQRILEAARECFADRGLSVTLDDIAKHAGVGVGTVYRRFPDKEQLIDALFEDRIAEMAGAARAGAAADDPWQGLVDFLVFGMEAQVADRGFKEVVFGSSAARERINHARGQIMPHAITMVERAKAAGALREDFDHHDLPLIQMMVAAVADVTRDVDPEAWRRYFALLLDGLRPGAATPLPHEGLDTDQLEDAMACWRPPRR